LKNVTPLRTGKICRKEGSLLRSDFGIIGAEFWFVKHYLPTFLLRMCEASPVLPINGTFWWEQSNI
jgi:hypothetical protein